MQVLRKGVQLILNGVGIKTYDTIHLATLLGQNFSLFFIGTKECKIFLIGGIVTIELYEQCSMDNLWFVSVPYYRYINKCQIVPTPIIINVNLFPKLYINCPNQE